MYKTPRSEYIRPAALCILVFFQTIKNSVYSEINNKFR